ncbi:hypothetical protein [Piscicoccus intestinalis]|uniref:hypothetical protein n=1 Tax=Piscicoccus intestinalis TaxID=746033 RepID=UPI0012ED0C62|nr:hypothetical protein [Piscicoccus intestinalis]
MARGINTAADVPSTTIDGQDINQIWGEFQQTLDLANQRRTAIASLFTFDTTLESDVVGQMGAGDDFEEASEFGVPTSMRTTHSEVRMGFPIRWFDKASRYTWAFLRDATADQVATVHAQALEADNRLVYRGVLNALLSNVNRTNEDGHTVFALWNGDGQVPPEYAGETFDGDHTHYLTSESATVDGADLRDLINHVTHHGYGVGGGEQLVILMNPAETEAVRGLRVADGSPYDFIPSESAPAY